MFILKGIDQLEKAIAKAKKVRPVSSLTTSDAIAYQARKATTPSNANARIMELRRSLASAKARKKVWYAITPQPLSRFTSD